MTGLNGNGIIIPIDELIFFVEGVKQPTSYLQVCFCSVHLSTYHYLPTYLCVYLSISSLSVYVSLTICLSLCPSVCLSVCLSICLFIYLCNLTLSYLAWTYPILAILYFLSFLSFLWFSLYFPSFPSFLSNYLSVSLSIRPSMYLIQSHPILIFYS